jgi:hypothetical protein
MLAGYDIPRLQRSPEAARKPNEILATAGETYPTLLDCAFKFNPTVEFLLGLVEENSGTSAGRSDSPRPLKGLAGIFDLIHQNEELYLAGGVSWPLCLEELLGYFNFLAGSSTAMSFGWELFDLGN